MAESFEAVARCRSRHGGEFVDKWMTVPTDDKGEASRAFQALGYEVRGLRIMTQEEATAAAHAI